MNPPRLELAVLTSTLALLASCKDPPPPSASDAGGTVTVGTGSAPSSAPSAPASATPDHATAPACRAIVNVRVTSDAKGDAGAESPSYWVAEVRVGDDVKVHARPGLVASTQRGLFALSIAPKQRAGTTRVEWQDVVATPLAKGKPVTVFTTDPGNVDAEDPDAGVAGPFNVSTVSVVSLVGGALSLHVSTESTPGAHPNDSERFAAVDVPSGAPHAWLKTLGPKSVTAMNEGIAKAEKDRVAQGLTPPNLPRMDKAKLGADVAFAFYGASKDNALGPFGPHARAILDCCTWAENHGRIDMGAPLTALPAGLVFEADSPTPIKAPDSCGAVGVRDGKLVVKRASGDVVTPAWSGPRIEELVGVSWVDKGAVVRLEDLPEAKTERRVQTLLASARSLHQQKKTKEAIVVIHEALGLAPNDPQLLTDLAWMEFQAGNFDEAKKVNDQALTVAETDAQRASVLYNLGRIAEASGDAKAARDRYTESLQKRANPVVKKRLEALPK